MGVYLLVMWTAIRNWSHEVEMKSRFYMDSNFHRFCDILGYACLLGTTIYFADPTWGTTWTATYRFLYLHTLLWWLRGREIMLLR